MSEQQPAADESVELASGARMPLLGLGTWQAAAAARSKRCGARSRSATGTSTRRRCTATKHRSVRQWRRAAAARAGLRDDEAAAESAGRERATLEESLAALGFERVDLWLIHWPPGGRARPDVWERLLELQAEGLAREVGVSNYSIRQIDELERATGRLPAVNQIEWSPALFDADVLAAHRGRGVQLEGYSPLKGDESPRPRARADREGARRHAGAGRPPLAHPASDRRDPEVDEPAADRRERRHLRLHADPREVEKLNGLADPRRR